MAAAAKSAVEETMEDANSVPVFTAEDEQRERQSLTEEERRRIAADLCGVETSMASLTVSSATETSSNDSSAFRSNFWTPASQEQQLQQRQTTPTAEFERNMNLLNTELGAIPGQEKEAYRLAMLQCPDQVFGGWRGEVISEMQESGTFDAKKMAKKFVSYWQRRYEAFGEDLAFKPMTLAGAMAEEVGSMASFCVYRVSPCKDTAGRAVMVVAPRRWIKSLYPRHRQKRALWYMLECLAQDPDTRKNGAVIIADGRGAHPGLFDHTYVRWAAGTLDAFPVQWKAVHCVNVNPFVRHIALPCFKFFSKKDTRNRILVHSGKTCTQTLAQYRLPLTCLPAELNLGGTVEMNCVKWIQDRYALEEFGTPNASHASTNSFDSMEVDGYDAEPTRKRSRTVISRLSSPPASSFPAQDFSIGDMRGKKVVRSAKHCGTSQSSASSAHFAFTKEEEVLLSNTTGRKTDERMSRAVVLCLRYPKIDRTEALKIAGFKYDKSKKVQEKKLLDSEGVSLRQRKNQLRRRLKQIAEKQEEEAKSHTNADSVVFSY